MLQFSKVVNLIWRYAKLLAIVLSIILGITLIFSIRVVIKKRKESGITGFKTLLTSICFFLIAIINLLAYWFHFMGIINWTITMILLILGAYFTKYMKMLEE